METVRAYAESHLLRNDELDDARDRHLEHQLETAGESTPEQWLRLMSNLDAAIDWAIARDRWSDAAELLAAEDAKWFYLPLSRSKLDRLDLVFAALPASSPLKERLRIAEIQFASAVGDEQRELAAARQATEASDESVRFLGFLWTAQMMLLADPDESMRLADAAEVIGHVDEIGLVDGIRAYVHMLAGEYQQALALSPHAGAVGVTWDAAIAALLLMDGQASAALAMADHHPLAESSWNAFSVIVGLSELALGRHEDAERDLVRSPKSRAGSNPLGLQHRPDRNGRPREPRRRCRLGHRDHPRSRVTAADRDVRTGPICRGADRCS